MEEAQGTMNCAAAIAVFGAVDMVLRADLVTGCQAAEGCSQCPCADSRAERTLPYLHLRCLDGVTLKDCQPLSIPSGINIIMAPSRLDPVIESTCIVARRVLCWGRR